MDLSANALPVFEAREDYPYRILPDGVYPCDEAGLRAGFVAPFPDSETRPAIFEGFLRLRAEVVGLGIPATQWVDGSFVEAKLDPEDVDVVSFLDYDKLEALDDTAKEQLRRLLDGRTTTKAAYRSHTFAVASCSLGHPFYPTFEMARRYWRGLWGKTRPLVTPEAQELPGHTKGFVAMPLGDPAQVPHISPAKE